jgi:two-component system, OmpR family, sensor histidine kinase MtrB
VLIDDGMSAGPIRGRLNLRLRALLAWAAIILVLSAALSASAFQVTRARLVAERESGGVDRAYLNARALRTSLRTPDADVTAVLSSLEANAGSIVLARVAGEWFSGSVGSGPESLPHSLVSAVAAGRAGRQRTRIGGAATVVVGVPIPEVDARYFEIVPLADIERTLDSLRDRLVAAAAAAALVAAAAGWYASGRVLRPLRELAATAEEIAGGRLDSRVSQSRDRDLQVIERAFNRMADSIQERIDREARFTSDVSHELRSPVAAMLSAVNIARRTNRASGIDAPVLDSIEERAEVLHRTVEDLLEISRVEAGVATLQLAPVDPVRLAHAVLERMGREGVAVDHDETIAPTALDKRRVGQMLQNLVDNADRYGGGARRIVVTELDGWIRFAVEDAGAGVAPHERSRIFERFARGEEAGTSGAPGTGLGLALVAEHAALHGGCVRLDEAFDQGARFVIELPVSRPW